MSGHFRGGCTNKSEILRALWRQFPDATPGQIRAKLLEIGHTCSISLVRRAKRHIQPGPNKEEQYTLDEIRAVHEAAQKVGGLIRLAGLVVVLVVATGMNDTPTG